MIGAIRGVDQTTDGKWCLPIGYIDVAYGPSPSVLLVDRETHLSTDIELLETAIRNCRGPYTCYTSS